MVLERVPGINIFRAKGPSSLVDSQRGECCAGHWWSWGFGAKGESADWKNNGEKASAAYLTWFCGVKEGFRGLLGRQKMGRERFVCTSRVESGVVLFSPIVITPERPRQGHF